MSARFDPAVSDLLDANKHPLRKEIDQLRTIILGVDKSIEEGVKWNTASFKTSDWFATLNGPNTSRNRWSSCTLAPKRKVSC